ncbi:tetratricopeptide repeat protein [Pontibacter liquoris]|uniref:tetratricopeptide repeat protein n=1 Tax=Pontibacter liquoris TaxID=2905677 RepID=UPI001FA78E88|nr:tetratricopeptide repeat protein [Pontibacter liquoris]
MGRFTRLLVLLLTIITMAACRQEEGEKERMVNLQKIQDNPEAQLRNLNAAIANARRDGSLYARRAVVLLRKGELNKALQDADEAIRLTKSEPLTLFVKAQVLRAMGRRDEALPLALQAERNAYQSASLYVLLGELYLQQRKYEQATYYIGKAQELAPGNEFAYYYRGRIQEATGDTSSAVHNYKLALKQMPQFMEAQRELTGILVARKDFEGAKPYLQSAARLAPDDALLLYYQGVLYQVAQKPDSAQLYFAHAVALNDTLQEAHYFIGLRQYAKGDGEGALAHLLKAGKKYKDQPRYLAALGASYERAGQPFQALATYQRLVQVDPRYTYAYQAIARIKYKLQRGITTDSTVVTPVTIEE